jgi:hypothetical protein
MFMPIRLLLLPILFLVAVYDDAVTITTSASTATATATSTVVVAKYVSSIPGKHIVYTIYIRLSVRLTVCLSVPTKLGLCNLLHWS